MVFRSGRKEGGTMVFGSGWGCRMKEYNTGYRWFESFFGRYPVYALLNVTVLFLYLYLCIAVSLKYRYFAEKLLACQVLCGLFFSFREYDFKYEEEDYH